MGKPMRLAVFIDFSNLWQAQKKKGKFLDYKKLTAYLKATHAATNIQVFFYTAYPADGTRSYSLDSKHRFYVFLEKELSFIVRKKPLKQISVTTPAGLIVQEKGNMDVEMTIDAVDGIKSYDMAILFTGDSDFLSLVTYIRKAHKKVYVYSSANNISSELRTGSNGYRDILKIDADIWGRDLSFRAEKHT